MVSLSGGKKTVSEALKGDEVIAIFILQTRFSEGHFLLPFLYQCTERRIFITILETFMLETLL